MIATGRAAAPQGARGKLCYQVRRRRQVWRCWWFELLLLGALGLSFALWIQTKLISSIKHPNLQRFLLEVEVFCVKCVRLICLGAGSRGAKRPFKHVEATVTSPCCLRDMHGHHGEDTDPFHVCLFSSYPATGLTGV